MKGLHVAFALMLLTGPALAQGGINLLKGDGLPKTMDEIQKEAEVEAAPQALNQPRILLAESGQFRLLAESGRFYS